jgi:peroxiredoxin
MSNLLHRSIHGCLLAVLLCAGCGDEPEPAASSYGSADGGYGHSGYGGYDSYSSEIVFADNAASQAPPEVGLYDLTFTTLDGKTTAVRDYGAGKSIVLVVTRGNTQPVCPFCSTQTANFIRDYAQFQSRSAEVVLVYPVESPGDEQNWSRFLADVRTKLNDPEKLVPFPVVFDVNLTAVDRLGIRKDLSKPATYIVDPQGQVRYAYVGAHWADRPSIAAVLKELDKLAPPAEANQADATETGEAVPPDAGENPPAAAEETSTAPAATGEPAPAP